MPLLACPFCREVFAPGERSACPVCGVPLVAFDKLPRSHDASPDASPDDDVPPQPEFEPLSPFFLGRRRGVLALSSLAGLAAFFAPWVELTMPDVASYSGWDLARRLGWAWAAGVAWFVLLPLVLTRRSIVQMRGARVAAAFLAAVPGTTAALLWARPPHGAHGVPVRFTFAWGLHATLALSLVAVAAAVSFGGRLDDIRVRRGSSLGRVVH